MPTVPVKPPCDVTVTVYFAVWLPFTVTRAGATAIEKSRTCCVYGAELLPVKLTLPP